MSAPAAATATILFTDLVGFTEYNDACGDAAAVAVLDRQTDIARDAVEAATGRVVKELGDGLMLWFADTGNGLRAAIEMLAAVERARATDDFPLALRMGMHCGDVVERGDDFVGQTVNVAARIADLAGPGELLASEDVVGAAGIAPTSFRPVGPTRVKGVATPVWLYRLVG